MSFAERLTRLLGKPEGVLGALLGWSMRRANASLNELTLEALEIGPNDRVLEIGFGPGESIARAAALAEGGFVAGVDASMTMVRAARRHNRRLVEAGRVELLHGTVEALPYPEESFDKAFAVNTLYFWTDPRASLGVMRRALRPGGRMAIGFRAKQSFPPGAMPGARLYSVEEVERLLEDSGLDDIRVASRTAAGIVRHCVSGRR